MDLDEFTKLHESQLSSAKFPKSLYNRLHEKLNNGIYDVLDVFEVRVG